MEQKICGSCDGELKMGITNFIVQVGDDVIIIRKVPALICEDCGEKYYTPEVSRRIDVVMKKYFDMKRSHMDEKESGSSFSKAHAIQTELPA